MDIGMGDQWEELIAAAMPDAKTFVDIGMNKGYSSANLFALWAPQTRLNAQSVFEVLKSDDRVHAKEACGACNDCRHNFKPAPAQQGLQQSMSSPSEVTVYGFEPGLTNFALCTKIRDNHPGINWVLERKAVSDKPG